MMLLHAGRGSGKTTQALAWVSHGERVPGYPGWSRVLVVCHLSEFERLRREWGSWTQDHETGDRVRRLEDFDHRVYPINEWLNAHHVSPSTEVCIDNLDMVIHGGWRNFPGWIAAVTITAEPWEHQTFHESVHQRSGAR